MSQRGSGSTSGQQQQQQQQPPADPNKTIYAIAVKTSDVFGAGTDANVFVQLIGTKGTSPATQLKLKSSINHRNKFERKHSDVFIFPDMQQYGDIKQVKIWHDNTGIGAAWHLEKVDVHDAATNTIYKFPCSRWLSKKDDDGQLCRVLNCTGKQVKVPRHIRMQQEQMQRQMQEQQQQQQDGSQQSQTSQQGQYPPAQSQYPPQGQSGVQPQNQQQYQAAPPSRSAKSNGSDGVVIVPKTEAQLQMNPYNSYGYGYGYGYPQGGYGYNYPPQYGYGPYGVPVTHGGYNAYSMDMGCSYGGLSQSWS